MKSPQFKLIDPREHQLRVLELLQQLNPDMETERIKTNLLEMAKMSNYSCFGLFFNDELIGISGGWTTLRIYCGKQLELDNVIIDPNIQSKGFGKYFLKSIKTWSVQHNYNSIGLNTYVQNARSHKFYFNEGFKVLGFHFEQEIA